MLIRNARDIPPPPADEERELRDRALAGDAGARDSMVLSRTGYVVRCARAWSGQAPYQDLFQAGMEGLSEALERWDPDRGARFLTYADCRIRCRMRQTLEDCNVIRYPHRRVRRMDRFLSLSEKYGGDYERAAAEMGMSPGERDSLLKDEVPVTVELYDEQGEPTGAVDDSVRPPWETADVKDIVRICAAELPEDDVEMVLSRYGAAGREPKTLKELAGIHGISIPRVHQRLSKSMKRLIRAFNC